VIKQWKYGIIGVGLLLGGLLLYNWQTTQQMSNTVASCIIAPFLRVQHVLLSPIKNYYNRACTQHAQQIMALELERDQLISELIALKGSKDFIQSSRELVSYQKRYDTNEHILAHIVEKKCDPVEQSVLVDRGSWHGVLQNMIAVYKNVLIGRVIEVYPYWSKIALITDPRCKVAVYCARTKATGIAEGVCDKELFVVNHVSHLDTVHVGDYIISSGSGLVFPKGFGVGIIERCVQDGLLYTLYAKPFIPLDRIEYCYLLQKGT